MPKPAPPAVEIHPGILPPFWDRGAVFLANLRGMFFGNEGGLKVLHREIQAVPSYGGRLLPIIDLLFTIRPNLLVLEQTPDERLTSYFTSDLGLTLPEVLVLPASLFGQSPDPSSSAWKSHLTTLDGVRLHPSRWIDAFVTDQATVEWGVEFDKSTVSTFEGSHRGNNKLLLHQYAEAQGLPTFEARVACDSKEAAHATQELRRMGYSAAVVKAQIGASGIGIKKITTEDGAAQLIEDYFFHEGPCLVQGWIDESLPDTDVIGSPSVQLFIAESTVHLYEITEQILNADKVHQGNLSPPAYFGEHPEWQKSILDAAAIAATWLHEQGYRGTASADFLLVRRKGIVEPILCEINARVTGATYPAILSRKFNPEGAWLMRNLTIHPPLESRNLLGVLDRAGLLFKPDQRAGVLPVNFNLNSGGAVCKGQFLCLGRSIDACLNLLHLTESFLPLEWRYDRD